MGTDVEWNAESLRLSVFLIDPVTPADELGLWRELTDADPDQTHTQHFGHVATAEGVFSPGRLRLTVGPSRIDWHLTATPKDSSTPYLSLGPYESTWKPFGAKMRTWLENRCPPLQRIAYAPVLNAPMTSIATANAYLNEHLESLQLRHPDQAADVELRLNLRQQSRIQAQIQINRLATWSAVEVQAAQLAVSPNTSPESLQLGPAAPVCRLQMDINTAPDNTAALPRAASLFDELAQIALALTKEGDRA